MPAATCETGYCVKCKKKMKMTGNCARTKTKNGRNMIKGECSKCGTTMCKFVK